MCLRQKKHDIANEDIVCYKVVMREIHNGVVEFASPFVLGTISKDVIEGKTPFIARKYNIEKKYCTEISEDDFSKLLNQYCIGHGAIHTFSSRTSAKKVASWFRSFCTFSKNKVFIVFKCIIPKGTQYYYGTCDNGSKGYASRQIIFKEILN
jgi:hypothetical protein